MLIETLTDDVGLETEGAPYSVIEDALRRSMRDFCAYTRRYVDACDPVTLEAGTADYTLFPPKKTSIITLEFVVHSDRTLPVWSVYEASRLAPGWGDATDTKPKVVLFNSGTAQITVYPKPSEDVAHPLFVYASLQPTMRATSLPDVLIPYTNAIVAGAVSWLKRMVDKPWTDRQGHSAYYAEFQRGLSHAAADQNNADAGGRLRVSANPFA